MPLISTFGAASARGLGAFKRKGSAIIRYSYNVATYGGGYLTLGSQLTLSSDFTIMAWCNIPTGGATNQPTICGNTTTQNCQFRLGGGTIGNKLLYYNQGVSIEGTTTIPENTWFHVAVVKSGTTVKIYYNGVLESSGSDANPFYIQYLLHTYTDWVGTINNLVVDSSVLYTTNFTPPAYNIVSGGSQKILTAQSSTLVDNSPVHNTLIPTGSVTPVAVAPF
jgi:hypothetical protein